jgi:hypothetical protein
MVIGASRSALRRIKRSISERPAAWLVPLWVKNTTQQEGDGIFQPLE